jgi:hypothetical protein
MDDLDQRMIDAGMTPLSKLLSRDPMGKFAVHNAVHSIEDFEWWVNQQHEQYLRMRMRYELGDKPKDDDLYEWVLAHSAVFGRVAATLRQALGKPV